MPQAERAGGEEQQDGQGAHAGGGVGSHHHHAAIPAVDQGARERSQRRRGKGERQRGHRQLRHRAGLEVDPHRQPEAGHGRAQDRHQLAAPDRQEGAHPRCRPLGLDLHGGIISHRARRRQARQPLPDCDHWPWPAPSPGLCRRETRTAVAWRASPGGGRWGITEATCGTSNSTSSSS